MTHCYQTSIHKSNRNLSHNFYQVEVIDFDMESNTYEVMANSTTEANAKATDMAASDGIEIYMMNIYKL